MKPTGSLLPVWIKYLSLCIREIPAAAALFVVPAPPEQRAVVATADMKANSARLARWDLDHVRRVCGALDETCRELGDSVAHQMPRLGEAVPRRRQPPIKLRTVHQLNGNTRRQFLSFRSELPCGNENCPIGPFRKHRPGGFSHDPYSDAILLVVLALNNKSLTVTKRQKVNTTIGFRAPAWFDGVAVHLKQRPHELLKVLPSQGLYLRKAFIDTEHLHPAGLNKSGRGEDEGQHQGQAPR